MDDRLEGFRCVLMDQRGTAERSGALGRYLARAMGRDIGAVLDAVARDRPVVRDRSQHGLDGDPVGRRERPELFGGASPASR